MKTLVLIVVLSCLHVTSLYAKECRILTSQPDYTRMKLITADSIWQSLPKLAGKKMKYVSFTEAYRKFYNNMLESIKEDCRKYREMKGVVNLHIQHSVTKDGYYFIATYDVFE